MSSTLIRWGAPAALLSGVLWIVYAVGVNFIGESHALYHVFNAPPYAFLAVGIMGLYAYLRQTGHLGKLGKFGFYLCAVVSVLEAVGGLAIIVSETAFDEALVPFLDIIHPMVLLMLLGSMLSGFASLRAGVLPRGGALLIVVVPVASLGTLFAGIQSDWLFSGSMALLGLGWTWLGYGLWSHRSEVIVQPLPVENQAAASGGRLS